MPTRVIFAAVLFVAGVACESKQPPAEPEADPKAATAAADAPAPTSQPAAAEAPQPSAVTAPEGAKVMFVEPADGAEVTGPLKDGKVAVSVKMGVEGIAVQPAGEPKEGTGHHHIVIDGAGIALGLPVPKDETHLHFGKGQTETELSLTPGEHSLTMQFADGLHRSYGPTLSTTIKVTVKAAE